MRLVSSHLNLVLVHSVHLFFLRVETTEDDEEEDTGGEGNAGQRHEHPLDSRVVGDGDKGLSDSGAKGVGEQVHGLNEGLHGDWGLGVGVFETGDGGKNLGDTDEHVSGGLDGDMDVVAQSDTVDLTLWTGERVLVAWSCAVDEVLDDGSVGHGKRGNDETDGDTGDGWEWDVKFLHDRVDDAVEDGDEDENGNGVEVLHEIVGDAVPLHLSGLGDEVTGELVVNDPVDWVEAEDLAGNEGTLELVDKLVVPGDGAAVAVLGLVGRLGGVHVAAGNHDPESAEGIGDDGAGWRADDVGLASEDEGDGSNHEDAETEQVGGPEADVQLHVRGGQQGERTDVDTGVEDHVDSLDGDGRVDDDTLASGQGRDGGHTALVLVSDQGSDIGLDTTGTDTDDDDRGNESTETSSVGERVVDRGSHEDDETGHVDEAEVQNGLVLSEVLVGNNGTEDRSN